MQITLDLVKKANDALIHHKRYSKEIEDRAARLPLLTAEQINSAWAKVKEKDMVEDNLHGREPFTHGTLLKHFKHDLTEGPANRYLYEYVGQVEHTETREKLVLYRAMYGDMKLYVRPVEMFYSAVDKTKYPDAKQEWRFEPF